MTADTDIWELYQDKRGQHRWRRRALNGNVVGASAQGYAQKSRCTANAQRHGMDGNLANLGGTDRWEIYKDKRGEFRWRRAAPNRDIVGASSESYKNKTDCHANAQRNGMP